MKKMLINATQKEEVRIALVEDKQLIDLDVEQRKNDNKKSNIYNGVISRVEPSLEACFVNYGEQRDGFLPIKDIHPSYYENLPGNSAKDKLKPGQKLIVQVAREERGNKGAALTTYVAIASTFLVLMPKSPDVEGISRRLSGEERDNLRQKLNAIGIKPTEGVIVRTAGTGCTTEELQYDLNILHFIWDMIQKYSEENPEVGILHHESETIVRVIRDYLTKDVDEIITDSKDAFNKVAHYLKLVRPKSKPHLTLKDVDNIFSCPEYDIESQIAQAYDREVKLKSGGSIVIDTTEALTAIDVNSSRSTGNQDIESTAISTNLEAADEIARQLKIRDIGGLIVIDFIDMNSSANQRKVEERMKKACGDDRARTQLARISKFGLLEVSRQRIRGSIAESINHKCPRCSGTGFIRDNESISLQILRQANEEATRVGKIVKLHIMVPNEIAAYLLNEKREKIRLLEQQHNIQIVVVPQSGLESPHYYIYRVRKGDTVKDSLSFSLPEYYRELEKTPRKARTVDRNDEKLTQSSTSVPLEHTDKTFEARLEKADFIQQAVAQEESEKSFFNRAKRWFAGLFTKFKKEPKVEEVVEEKVASSRRKRRRSRKERNRSTSTVDTSLDSSPVVTNDVTADTKFDKNTDKASGSSKRGSRAEKFNAEVNSDKVVETTPISVRKQIKSGDVVEEVLGGNSKRKRRKKEKNTFGDIDPQLVKSQVEQQEAALEQVKADNSEQKPKLTRAERRRLQRVKDLDPEYDYEFNEENLGLDAEVPTKSRRRKDKLTKVQLEAEKGVELSQEDIVNSKLDLLEADDISLDVPVPRKASRSERRRLAQERQAQAQAQEEEQNLGLDTDLAANSVVNSGTAVDKDNFDNVKVNKSGEAEAKDKTGTKAKAETNADLATIDNQVEAATVISNSDRKKSRRRRKTNVEKKDLFLSRVPSCIDQQTLNNWINPGTCDDLLDDIDTSEYAQVPSLMDVIASDGSVDIKERSPYRQVVRPSIPTRKSNVYLGVVNSDDFEDTMAKALDESAKQVCSSDDNADNEPSNLDKSPEQAVNTNKVITGVDTDQPVVNDNLTTVDNTDKQENLDKLGENLSRRERARRAKAAKEKVNNQCSNNYRYQVFKAKQPCVNFNVEYDKVNRLKKRYNALLNKKQKPLKENFKDNCKENYKDNCKENSKEIFKEKDNVINTNPLVNNSSDGNKVNATAQAPANSNKATAHKEVIITQFDDYAKNVGFTEELSTNSLNDLNTNLNPRNHLNSITEGIKDLTAKKQTSAPVKLNESKDSESKGKEDLDVKELDHKKLDNKKLDNKVSNTDTQSKVVDDVKVKTTTASETLPQTVVTSEAVKTAASTESNSVDKTKTTNKKLSPFLNLPDDSALVVFANKTTNSCLNVTANSSLEIPLLEENLSVDDLPSPIEACVKDLNTTNPTSSNEKTLKDKTVNLATTEQNVPVTSQVGEQEKVVTNTVNTTPTTVALATDNTTNSTVVTGGVLSKARSFSVGSTITKVEHSEIDIPVTFDQYESNYTYCESGKSVSSPSKHTSTK